MKHITVFPTKRVLSENLYGFYWDGHIATLDRQVSNPDSPFPLHIATLNRQVST